MFLVFHNTRVPTARWVGIPFGYKPFFYLENKIFTFFDDLNDLKNKKYYDLGKTMNKFLNDFIIRDSNFLLAISRSTRCRWLIYISS